MQSNFFLMSIRNRGASSNGSNRGFQKFTAKLIRHSGQAGDS
jgi:hypothetical protein